MKRKQNHKIKIVAQMLQGTYKYLILLCGLIVIILIPMNVIAQEENRLNNDSIEIAETDSVSVTIYVSFVVDTNGAVLAVKVKDVKCDSTLSYKDCNKKLIRQYKKEAKRVVESSGPWKPAKQDGEQVRIKFILPIRMKVLRTDILK